MHAYCLSLKYKEYSIRIDSSYRFRVGDLIVDEEGLSFLVLESQSSHIHVVETTSKLRLAQRQFLDPCCVRWIEWMSTAFFSSLGNVLSAFFVPSFEELYAYASSHPISVKKMNQQTSLVWNNSISAFDLDEKMSVQGQHLFVFPDLRSIHSLLGNNEHMTLLHSHMSPVMRKKIFHMIRQGVPGNYVLTPAGLFFPWNDVRHISVVDPAKWYYKTQSDPRISLPQAFEYLANLYQVPITYIN